MGASGVSRAKLVAAFAAVYVIWGSTYLAILFAIESIPPFLMAGARYLIAGSLLYPWTRLRGAGRPTRRHWGSAFVVGGLLLLGGNGGVVWAEQHVPSGVVALVVAVVPLWMVLLDWLWGSGNRPGAQVMFGIVLGLAGLALLVGWGGGQRGAIDPIGVAVVVVGSLSWAAGSLYSRRAKLPPVPLQATAMEMLGGGVLLAVFGILLGEPSQFVWDEVTTRSLLALLYLVVFGSLIAFTAYIWLLSVTTPARVATYAYVNPVVAVLLGWSFAGEPLTPRMLLAAAVIITSVAIITTAGAARPSRSAVGASSRRD